MPNSLFNDLVAFLWQRLQQRRWKGYSFNVYDINFVEDAARNFMKGICTETEIKVLGLPMENSREETAIRRWMSLGLSDSHVKAIDQALSKMRKANMRKKAKSSIKRCKT